MKSILFVLVLITGEPKVVQDPPKPLKGTLVFLSVTGEKISKLSAISSRADVPCRTVQEVGGRWLVITQAPQVGSLTVILAAVEGGELFHWKHEVVGGLLPEPDHPDPPPVPDQLTGFAKIAFDLVSKMPAREGLKQEAAAVSSSF